MSSRYLVRQLLHKASKAPTACSVLTRDPSSTVSTRVSIPPLVSVMAILPSSDKESFSSRAVVFSANLEYFLQSLRRLMRGGTALGSRTRTGSSLEVERLWRAVTASTLPWTVPELRICTRSSAAPEAAIVGLLGGAAESVKIAAVANSLRLLFLNLRSSTRGGMAPDVTIFTLFLINA